MTPIDRGGFSSDHFVFLCFELAFSLSEIKVVTF